MSGVLDAMHVILNLTLDATKTSDNKIINIVITFHQFMFLYKDSVAEILLLLHARLCAPTSRNSNTRNLEVGGCFVVYLFLLLFFIIVILICR